MLAVVAMHTLDQHVRGYLPQCIVEHAAMVTGGQREGFDAILRWLIQHVLFCAKVATKANHGLIHGNILRKLAISASQRGLIFQSPVDHHPCGAFKKFGGICLLTLPS